MATANGMEKRSIEIALQRARIETRDFFAVVGIGSKQL